MGYAPAHRASREAAPTTGACRRARHAMIRPKPRPTLLAGALLLGALLQPACGSSSPETKTASDTEVADRDDGTEPASEDTPRPSDAPAGQCFDKCQELIEDAGALLDQARALKGAEKAQLALYLRAGTAHIRAFRGCDLRQPRGEDLACKGADQVVTGMVQAFEGAKRPDQVVFAYLVALDERFRDDNAEVTGAAPGGLREAATAALELARKDPKAAHAADSMAAAGYAALALDEVTEAQRIATELAKKFGRTAPEAVTMLAAAIAGYFNDREQFDEALSTLTADTSPARAKSIRATVTWQAERGRALLGAGKGGAGAAFAAVTRAWRTPDPKDPSKVVGRQEPAPMLGRERVVDAVGAAHFSLGEIKRAEAEKLRPPKYTGPKSADGVERFIGGPLARWAQLRQRAVAAADQEYQKVLAIRPVPPPRWVVAASAQSGKAWSDLAEAMVKIELPAGLSDHQAAFEKSMRASAQPARDNARRAFERCREHAKSAQIEDDRAAACEQGLASD